MRSVLLVAAIGAASLFGCSGCGGSRTTQPAPASGPAVSEERAPSAEPSERGPDLEREPATARRGRRDPARSPLGTNVSLISDWSTELPFVDQFRTSRPWLSGPGAYGGLDQRPIDVDARGWVRSLLPQQAAKTLLLWENPHAPSGRYTVLYEGTGEIAYFGGVDGHVVERRPGRDVIDWDPPRHGQDFGLAIVRTDPADPIRNIRVLLPGGSCEDDERVYCDERTACASGARCLPHEETYETRIWNPRFLEQLDLYGVIRFMNWQATNDSTVSRWEERARLEDIRWSTGKGFPLEVLIDLANLLDVDAWICMPHLADDRFVREAARLVASRLEPERRVYVEYSNEVWNGIFRQAEHARQQGARARLGGSDEYRGQIRWYARRARQVFRAFSEGFPDRARVVRVLGGFAPNDWVSNEMLSFESIAADTDVLAIAPYFGIAVQPDNRDEFMGMTVEQVLARASRREVPESLSWVRAQRAVADQHGVGLVAYEAGQHYVALGGLEGDEAVQRRLREIDRHPQLEHVYLEYLRGWREAGGGLMMHFVHVAEPSRYGNFGARYWLEQPMSETPKLRAIVSYVDSTPRWW